MTAPSQDSARPERYTNVAIALHWIIALCLGIMIALGKNMYDAEHREIEWMFQLHKSVGITILTLMIARLVWRLANRPPPLPATMKPVEKSASHITHMALYALMFGLPLSGWVMVSLSPFSIATVLYGTIGWPHLPGLAELAFETRQSVYPKIANIHEIMSWALIALFALHVIAAVKHEISDDEGVLKRMLPRLFGKTTPPQAPARGAWVAFGSAFAFFGIIAGGPVIAQSLTGPETTPATSDQGNWDINYDASEIRFSGTHSGNAFSGVFEDWSATINFDPDALGEASASVLVTTQSARTGDTLYDNTLEAAEWFNVTAFPQATVSLSNFRLAEDAEDGEMIADATLTIKEAVSTVDFRFHLGEADGVWTMTGETLLARETFELGQESDATGDWVSTDITVSVTVEASPTAP